MHIRTTILFAGFFAFAGVAFAENSDLPYSSGSTGADGPLDIPGTPHMRFQIASAYDAERDQIVIFGGNFRRSLNNGVSNSTKLAETWLFDGSRWTQAFPTTVPTARTLFAMTYDPVREEVVMFGGVNSGNGALGDTWVWDGSDWTRKTPVTSPPASGFGKMVWDAANNRVLMFGNRVNGNPNRDFWAWDGSDWSEITPATDVGTSPPTPAFNAMAYDVAGDRTILYNELLRQTWAFDGTDWSRITTTASPDTGTGPAMTYDVEREEIVYFGGGGSSQTWIFKDDDWTLQSPATAVGGRSFHGLEYFASQSEVVAVCGDNGSWAFQDTNSWDGTDWTRVLERSYTFDMTGRPDGVWNFTSINVPAYTEVSFTKNSTNTAVTWLATENVIIAGRLLLIGQHGTAGVTAGGAPGGSNGGTGGVPGSLLGLYAGSPGAGPGGGAPGVTLDQNGSHATHRTTYGNALVQPPTGGSGGGGGGADDGPTGNGGHGGAGGGAIVIKSSRDITIPRGNILLPLGGILVNGGNNHRGVSNSFGGCGSGGSVRLVADRVSGNGTLQAYGGLQGSTRLGGDGWIRIETYFQPFGLVTQPAASIVSPVGTIPFGDQPTLIILSVAGETVPQPPAAQIEAPDVIFANNVTAVSIIVRGDNVPAGTEITLTIETPSGPLILPAEGDPAVVLGAGGTAVFNTILDDGHGTIRAFANYQVQP